MARLSISELNDLSGISKESLDTLYKYFRQAHTRLTNDLESFVKTFDSASIDLRKMEATSYEHDILVYKTARSMYYNGSQLLDSLDLFDSNTSEYVGFLDSIHNSETRKMVASLRSIIIKYRPKMLDRLSSLYGMYSEAYQRLNEEEDNYE